MFLDYFRLTFRLEYARAHQGDVKVAVRFGKVKSEHRQMETGKWEDPLRYLDPRLWLT